MSNCEAYDYCANHTLGLAMWNTPELYEDIKYLAVTSVDADLYTALNNANHESCSWRDGCHGKLLWRQTKTGYCDLFEANSAIHR